MAESESRSEESDKEELPALAFLLQHSPSARPPGKLGHRLSSSSAPKPDTEAGAVVVLSSGSEEEEEVEEVVPLSERMKRRMKAKREAVSKSSQPAGGDAGLRARGDLLAPGSRGPQEALVSTGDVSCGSQNGTCGAQWPSLCPLPASHSDSADHPSRPLVSGASPETSASPKKPKYSQKEKEVICQAAWQRRKEREARRRQQEQEKERKRALAKMLKAQRPGECQKYITVVLDPGACPHSLHLPYNGCCLFPVEA